MNARLGCSILVAFMVGMFAASSARATTAMLDSAMQRYALCRVAAGAYVAGGTSSLYRGRLVVDVLMSNGAQLIVRAGTGHHDVTWVSRNAVPDRLFMFRHLYNVPRRLREACRP